ncbi:hypothetical protein KY348_01300 [Candidatus Woesearchaeota archaeon]|nr:hypothetical protein [Candidatus Woesearchaeota archaeon]
MATKQPYEIKHSKIIGKPEDNTVVFSFNTDSRENLGKVIERIQNERARAEFKKSKKIITPQVHMHYKGNSFWVNEGCIIQFMGVQKGKKVEIQTRGDLSTENYLRHFLAIPDRNYY